MPSRDLWSPGAGTALARVVGSAIVTLLLRESDDRPVYFSSPWITDFPLYRNRFREFSPLFPELADRDEICFSDCLVRLAKDREVRLLTSATEPSRRFVEDERVQAPGIHHRFAAAGYHEKGILGPEIYIEGSMNITFSGMFINREKVSIHAGSDAVTIAKVAAAYLEFDRHWETINDRN